MGTSQLGIPPHLDRRMSGTQRDRIVSLGPGRCFALSSIFHSVSVPNMDFGEANPPTLVEKIEVRPTTLEMAPRMNKVSAHE